MNEGWFEFIRPSLRNLTCLDPKQVLRVVTFLPLSCYHCSLHDPSGKWPGSIGLIFQAFSLKVYLLNFLVTVCFPDTWNQMCSNQEKQCITFSIVRICIQRLHFPVWIFQLTHVGWHHRNHKSNKLNYMSINTPDRSQRGHFYAFLTLLWILRLKPQAIVLWQISTMPSLHPLKEKQQKLWSVSSCDLPGAAESLVLGGLEYPSAFLPSQLMFTKHSEPMRP